jgi:drug/metabolite transporter (DMT)-like permease
VTLSELGLLLLSIVAGVIGQFFLKTGALALGQVNAANAINLVLRMITIPQLVVGLALYGVGAIAYILLLTRVNLSIVGPSIALSYVFSVLLGYFVFKETIPVERIVGLGLIVCGVILVLLQKR